MAELIVTTAYDTGFAPMGDIAAERIRAHAARHGAAVHVERRLDTGRPPAWNKIVVIRALLAQGHDWVMWVDADALIRRLEVDIRDEIRPGKDLYLASHHQWSHPMPGMAIRYDVPNSGVMLLRNSAWTMDFLDQVWGGETWIDHPWWENAAIIDLMGYRRLLDPQGVNAPDPAVMDRLEPLDWNWNSVPGECVGTDPIILHYTRRGSFEERLAEMRADLEAARNREGSGP